MSVVAHFFMSVGGSEIHERLAHFFIDFYMQAFTDGAYYYFFIEHIGHISFSVLLSPPIYPTFNGLKCSVFGCFGALQSILIHGIMVATFGDVPYEILFTVQGGVS